MNGNCNLDGVPTVDLSAFDSVGGLNEQQKAADELAEAAVRYGCVAVTGHGIAPSALKKAFGYTRRLYGLPESEKLKARRPDDPMHHRGYSAPGREKAAAMESLGTEDEEKKKRLENVADYKESYEIGSEKNDEQRNIWLPEEVLPGFNDFMTGFYWDLHGASSRVLKALALGLNLPQAETSMLCGLHSGQYCQLRLAHYLPVSEELSKNETTFRLAAHRDFGTFTCLFQDGEHSGLEFQDPRTKEWMPAPPTANVLYLNIADLLHRLSNGRLPSSNHRVVTPQGENGRTATSSRYSIVYFGAVKGSEIIQPLESYVQTDGKRIYEPLTFSDYCMKMFTATQKPGE